MIRVVIRSVVVVLSCVNGWSTVRVVTLCGRFLKLLRFEV